MFEKSCFDCSETLNFQTVFEPLWATRANFIVQGSGSLVLITQIFRGEHGFSTIGHGFLL